MSSQKYIFLAGGMGITPFRSIIKERIDKKEALSTYLFHFASTQSELLFRDIFEEATKKIAIVYLPVLTKIDKSWEGLYGKFSKKLLEDTVPDWENAIYYLSGSEQFIQAVRTELYAIDIDEDHIKTDVFSGY